MQSVGGFCQREGLCHNGLDSAGLKQRDDRMPGFLPSRLWLSKQGEALDGGSFPDQICDVNACPAASRITECRKTSVRCKRSQRLAEDVTRDAVYHDVCATTAGDTSHPIAHLLAGEVNHPRHGRPPLSHLPPAARSRGGIGLREWYGPGA